LKAGETALNASAAENAWKAGVGIEIFGSGTRGIDGTLSSKVLIVPGGSLALPRVALKVGEASGPRAVAIR
jgi:hypothetical protein